MIGTKRTCLRCNHSWRQARDTTPQTCPKCHTYRWNEPYIRVPAIKKVEESL